MKTKKRKLTQYMKGTGNTGVRNYMPDPSEVLAQDDINKADAMYQGAINPFSIGLQTLAGLMEQFKGPLAGQLGPKGIGEFNEVPGATVERAAFGMTVTDPTDGEKEKKDKKVQQDVNAATGIQFDVETANRLFAPVDNQQSTDMQPDLNLGNYKGRKYFNIKKQGTNYIVTPTSSNPQNASGFKAQMKELQKLNPDAVFANNSYLQFKDRMAFGGEVDSKKVEVEGKEVIETPDGKTATVKGPRHEQGGVEADLPIGTKVFSDRIKVGGMTMAERKKARQNKMANLMKKLDKNPTDKILKNTVQRTQEVNESEEAADLTVQKFANAMEQMLNVAQGSLQKMNNGGIIYGGNPNMSMYEDYLKQYALKNPDFDINSLDARKSLQKELGVKEDGIFGPKTLEALRGAYYPLEGVRDPNPTTIDYNAIDKAFENLGPNDDASLYGATKIPNLATPGILHEGELMPPIKIGDGVLSGEEGGEEGNFLNQILNGTTSGDLLGIFGTAVSGFGPYLNTLKNRAGDTPNINAFENFGKDALEANESAKDYVGQIRDENIQDVKLARNTSIRRNRNTARGVNQMRALDITSDSNANEAIQNIYSTFAGQMMQLFNQQAGLENQQDQAVMTGEQKRDLADRMDKDNFDTKLGQDIATMGTTIQKFAKDLNTKKGNKDFLDILPDLSQYGIGYGYNKKGELVLKKAE